LEIPFRFSPLGTGDKIFTKKGMKRNSGRLTQRERGKVGTIQAPRREMGPQAFSEKKKGREGPSNSRNKICHSSLHAAKGRRISMPEEKTENALGVKLSSLSFSVETD